MNIKELVKEISDFLSLELLKIKSYTFQIVDLFYIALIITIAKLLLWLIGKWIKRQAKKGQIDEGRHFAFFQIIRYVIWVVAIVMVLDGIGVNITILLAGSAALLVGIGLGIQQTFNDFFSGIILLIDRTIQVGDVIEVDDIVATVKEIGVRASTVITREDIVVLIPNSKFTNDKVINWSHSRRQSRFKVKVGVSYDSDVELVKNCLLAVAKLDSRILKDPTPFVRLEDFGDSSMDFSINFWSDDAFRIEVIRSDIRFAIVKSFRENKITIPFPQRDLYIKQGGTSEK